MALKITVTPRDFVACYCFYRVKTTAAYWCHIFLPIYETTRRHLQEERKML